MFRVVRVTVLQKSYSALLVIAFVLLLLPPYDFVFYVEARDKEDAVLSCSTIPGFTVEPTNCFNSVHLNAFHKANTCCSASLC